VTQETFNASGITGWAAGEGPTVLMLPSLGRGADDFTLLGEALAHAGFRAVAIDPRGIGLSTGPLDDLTLHDYARDAASVIEHFGPEPVDVIGHAFGNRVARVLASDRPELVRRVVLIAAGGRQHIDPDVRASLLACFDTSLDDELHLRAVQDTFFAPGNDASVWRNGWWPEAATAQGAAVQRTPVDDWTSAGNAQVLIVQGLQDRVAPPEVGRAVREEIGARATYVELNGCGHALLPEAPDAIAAAVVRFLR
jgi:pimeloyl-ACP methyl ester carboxylesterase